MAVYPGVTTFDNSDMNRDKTSAIIYEQVGNGPWVAKGKVTSSGNRHAEEWFLYDINHGGNTLGVAAHGARIRMEIAKRPCTNDYSVPDPNQECHSCTGQLIDQKSSGRLAHLEIAYLGLYAPTSSLESRFENVVSFR